MHRGIALSHGALYRDRAAYNSIVKIPVKTDGSARTGVTFTTGLNGPDGLAVDANDSLWVAANQHACMRWTSSDLPAASRIAAVSALCTGLDAGSGAPGAAAART